jgi:hypothetical protein
MNHVTPLQPAKPLPGKGKRPVDAKFRLSGMLTQEVSIVDQAANLRRYVTIKAKDPMQTDATIALSSTAKQTLLDGLAQCLEKLQAVATHLGSATIDESAATPAPILEMLKEISQLSGQLATQRGPYASTMKAGHPWHGCMDLAAEVAQKSVIALADVASEVEASARRRAARGASAKTVWPEDLAAEVAAKQERERAIAKARSRTSSPRG